MVHLVACLIGAQLFFRKKAESKCQIRKNSSKCPKLKTILCPTNPPSEMSKKPIKLKHKFNKKIKIYYEIDWGPLMGY